MMNLLSPIQKFLYTISRAYFVYIKIIFLNYNDLSVVKIKNVWTCYRINQIKT